MCFTWAVGLYVKPLRPSHCPPLAPGSSLLSDLTAPPFRLFSPTKKLRVPGKFKLFFDLSSQSLPLFSTLKRGIIFLYLHFSSVLSVVVVALFRSARNSPNSRACGLPFGLARLLPPRDPPAFFRYFDGAHPEKFFPFSLAPLCLFFSLASINHHRRHIADHVVCCSLYCPSGGRRLCALSQRQDQVCIRKWSRTLQELRKGNARLLFAI